MFSGPPLPLTSDLPLTELLTHAASSEPLGAWLRGSERRLHLYRVLSGTKTCRILTSPDLGFLLRNCARIALREGERLIVLAAETLIYWRALQVVTATPYLPGLERLRRLFPGLSTDGSGLLVPIRSHSPEEVLSECLAEGLPVSASRVVYSASG